MKKLLISAILGLSTLFMVSAPAKAATLVSFGTSFSPSELGIPRGTLNPFRGGRGWGFRTGQTFSFWTQWTNSSSQSERVNLSFNVEEKDVIFDDIIRIAAAPFILPAQSSVTRLINFTLSSDQLNSLCEPSCNTNFGLGFLAEDGKLEFRVASPTFTDAPVATPEPSILMGLAVMGILGLQARKKVSPGNEQSVQTSTEV